MDNFIAGQVVWAKMEGFPWWPARVATMAEVPAKIRDNLVPRSDHILVYFFGDHNFAFLRDTKVQLFSEKHDERRLFSKGRNFKQALEESQQWIDSGSKPPPQLPPSIPSPPKIESKPTLPVTPIIQKPTSPLSTTEFQHKKPNTPTHYTGLAIKSAVASQKQEKPLPESSIITNISLSAELAKAWEYTEVDEDTIDDYVVISSEKDMASLVNYYNDHKRKMEQHLSSVTPKRVKTEPSSSIPNKPKIPNTHTFSQFSQPEFPTPMKPPHTSFTNISPSPVNLNSNSNSNPNPNPNSNPNPNPNPNPTPMNNKPIEKIRVNNGIVGTATNGFTVAPFHGVVEGDEDGMLVEFDVHGHTYRGFLIARESFPALISPIVPPVSSFSTPGVSPYSNLARVTAVSIASHHPERLAELGRLVVASALVPYAYPPPLYL